MVKLRDFPSIVHCLGWCPIMTPDISALFMSSLSKKLRHSDHGTHVHKAMIFLIHLGNRTITESPLNSDISEFFSPENQVPKKSEAATKTC